MDNKTTNTSIIEPINDDYEYIQYNDKLRLIHSIKDDMYQMQSIITSCNSNKQADKWFNNQSTQELLNEIANVENYGRSNLYQNKQNPEMGLRGYYVHRLLVNHVAIWASSKYSYYIIKLLDNYFEKQREELQNKITEQQPRLVPNGKQKCYKYMIWREDINKPGYIRLHLVRRNTKSFYELTSIYKSDACWYFRDKLPISMTPNEDIKQLVKHNFTGDEASIKSCNIDIKIELLDKLKGLITNYFDNMQNV